MKSIQPAILHGLTPESLSSLITDAFTGGKFKTKGEVRKRVEDLIKGFIRCGINGKELNKKKHQLSLEKENRQKIFWQRKMKELHPEEIESFYKELDETLIKEGLIPSKEPFHCNNKGTDKDICTAQCDRCKVSDYHFI